jgi:tripartite-type tricarboxylate transporter receptor subunit TctC
MDAIPFVIQPRRKMMIRRQILALAITAVMTLGANAQTFPDRPVKIITPYPPGTGPDTFMRLVGERLTRMWGQQVVIENRSGGNGFIAIDVAKRAAPDGYTYIQLDATPMTVFPHLFKKLPFDPAKDFESVAGMYRTYYYVTVAAGSPWNTVGDLLAAARAKPGKISYGSSGLGGNLHLGGAMLEKLSNVKMNHVPYKATTQIYIDVSSGEVDWAVGTASTTQPMLQAGKIKYLAVTAPKRFPLFPNIPTVAESQGPNDYELQTWVSMFAPRGVPKAILNKVNADVGKVLQDPEVRERFRVVGFEPMILTPVELNSLVVSDLASYGKLIVPMNISLD